MRKAILQYGLVYGAALAAVALVLQWAKYRYLVLSIPGEIYTLLVALVFAGIGIYLGIRLTPRTAETEFERNEKAISALGLTPRECEILAYLAKGASNKEIARALKVSPNTVKTHVMNLYTKLEVNGRGKAVDAARALDLIP